ncbi:uncharacterized protein LOC115799886 [Archocentrus centrarchus]|uniref:uncharacterized protein LOC115799886 n=1 Tax=Archocentrus centrarchus TaxID=63155 RepID=UPI0011EA343C|nr:ubiquitin thioesterase otulin [Archocentrus centrarchus]
MGNWCCCRHESPCSSLEERSGLLTDDMKATECTGSKAVVGSCGPEGDDCMRNEEGKLSPETGEQEPNNTQENGPLKKEVSQTEMPPPFKISEENTTRVQDKKETPAHSGQLAMQCASGFLQEERTNVDWEAKEENPASTQDRIPEGTSLTHEAVCPDNPPHTETNKTSEQIAESTTHHDEEEKVTVEAVANNNNQQVLSVPNTQLDAAAPAAQVSSTSVVNQEPEPEPLTCDATEHPDNSGEAGPEDSQSHDISQLSSGLEPSGLNHSGEERDSASSVREPKTTTPADASESLGPDQDKKPDPESAATSSEIVTSLEKTKQDAGEMMLPMQGKDEDVPKANGDNGGMKEEKVEAESAPTEGETQARKNAEAEEVTGNKELPAESKVKNVKLETTEKEDSLGNSEEDLYRGEEELSASQNDKPGPPPELETKFLKVEDRCSLSPAVNILSYSEREWKGNTPKSALIKKGYKEMSLKFGSVRRVRGDNYCALRATLFQVLSHSTQLPAWLHDENVVLLPKQLEAQEGLINQWMFPGECLHGDRTGDAIQQLKGYMELLRNTWQAAVDCASDVERQQLCERVFQGGEEELGLLEALKLLMLSRAVELHSCMQGGGDVPLFCWLLFARDSSDCPRSFLSNHLSHVGLTAGLEQVEMFLLGYALQCTIQVYRLYKADTEEFVTYYPDDHKDDWQSVCLVTEDDRHYNVPVVEAAESEKELPSS